MTIIGRPPPASARNLAILRCAAPQEVDGALCAASFLTMVTQSPMVKTAESPVAGDKEVEMESRNSDPSPRMQQRRSSDVWLSEPSARRASNAAEIISWGAYICACCRCHSYAALFLGCLVVAGAVFAVAYQWGTHAAAVFGGLLLAHGAPILFPISTWLSNESLSDTTHITEIVCAYFTYSTVSIVFGALSILQVDGIEGLLPVWAGIVCLSLGGAWLAGVCCTLTYCMCDPMWED